MNNCLVSPLPRLPPPLSLSLFFSLWVSLAALCKHWRLVSAAQHSKLSPTEYSSSLLNNKKSVRAMPAFIKILLCAPPSAIAVSICSSWHGHDFDRGTLHHVPIGHWKFNCMSECLTCVDVYLILGERVHVGACGVWSVGSELK